MIKTVILVIQEVTIIIPLTRNELELMRILWSNEEPMTSIDLNASPDRTWRAGTIQVLLRSLLSKKYIRACAIISAVTKSARAFTPMVSQEEYYAQYIKERQSDLSLPRFVMALLKDQQIDADTKIQLEAIIREAEETDSSQ